MQALLGHANTRTLMDTYMRTEQNDKQVSINMIEEHSVIKLHTTDIKAWITIITSCSTDLKIFNNFSVNKW